MSLNDMQGLPGAMIPAGNLSDMGGLSPSYQLSAAGNTLHQGRPPFAPAPANNDMGGFASRPHYAHIFMATVGAQKYRKYYFKTDVCLTSPNNQLTARDGNCQTSNFNMAVVFGGYNAAETNTVHFFDWLTEVQKFGTATTFAHRYGGAFGHRTRGYVGIYASGNYYIYATASTVEQVGNITNGNGLQLIGAFGGPLFGAWCGGFAAGVVVSKLLFATEATVAGTSLLAGRYGLAGMGGMRFALFVGGNNAGVRTRLTEKYTFNSDVVTSGTSLSAARWPNGCEGAATTGDKQVGYLFGAFNGSIAQTQVEGYAYARDTIYAGTSLNLGNNYGSASSSNPGNQL